MVLLANDHIAALYTNENSVSSMAAGLLLLVAMYQLFDNVQATGIGALRGYKDTSTPMFIALFSYWVVGLPIAAVLGLGNSTLSIEPMGVYGFWWGLAIGLAVAAVIITLRFMLVSRSAQHINKLALR